MTFVYDHGQENYNTGKSTSPKLEDPKFHTWRAEEHHVMRWLINSMTTDSGENFLLFSTSKEIWDVARNTFSNQVKHFQIKTTLQDLKQGVLFVTTYYTTLSRYGEQLNLFETHKWNILMILLSFEKLWRQIIVKFLTGLSSR